MGQDKMGRGKSKNWEDVEIKKQTKNQRNVNKFTRTRSKLYSKKRQTKKICSILNNSKKTVVKTSIFKRIFKYYLTTIQVGKLSYNFRKINATTSYNQVLIKITLPLQKVYKIFPMSSLIFIFKPWKELGLKTCSRVMVQLHNHGMMSCCWSLIQELQAQHSAGIVTNTNRSTLVSLLCDSTATSWFCYLAHKSEQALHCFRVIFQRFQALSSLLNISAALSKNKCFHL